MQENKSLKVNSVLNIIKTISSIIFPLITFPYISRILSPVNVGRINFGSSFVGYFSLIASLGITTYAIRECSAARNDRKKLGEKASEIFSINVCTTVIAYLLLAFFLVFFRRLDSYRTLIIVQSTAILFTTWGTDWLNSAMEDFKYITIRTIAFQFISLILMFVLVREQDDYLRYAVITVFSSSGANLANVFYRRKFCDVEFTKNMKWRVHFMSIMLLFVMILAQTIFNSADVTMLGLMKGDFEVGIYSTANKIKNIISQIVASLAWVIMPRMSIYFAEGDYEKIHRMLKKVLGVMIVIGLPCIAGCISLSREIVEIVGGKEFASASLPLIILMISFGFDLYGGSFLGNMVLLPSKHEKIFMIVCCATAVVNVVLNFFLIPIWGVSGAAFTTAISSLLIMLLLLLKKDKKIKLDYVWDVTKAPLVGSIAIIVICHIFHQIIDSFMKNLVFSILCSVLVYMMILIIMKNDIATELLKSIKKKCCR